MNKTKEIVRKIKLQRTIKHITGCSIIEKLGFNLENYKDDLVYTPGIFNYSDYSRIDEFLEDEKDIHTMYVECREEEDKVQSIVYILDKITPKGNSCEVILNVFNNLDQIYRLKEVTDWITQQKGMFCEKVFIWNFSEYEVMGILEI